MRVAATRIRVVLGGQGRARRGGRERQRRLKGMSGKLEVVGEAAGEVVLILVLVHVAAAAVLQEVVVVVGGIRRRAPKAQG